MKQALEHGQIDDDVDHEDGHYYKYLLDAERLVQELSFNGKIF